MGEPLDALVRHTAARLLRHASRQRDSFASPALPPLR
jgi:hypothetical protein